MTDTDRDRMEQLAEAIGECLAAIAALVADYVVGRGVDLFKAVCERDCEGIVAKLAGSPYRLLAGGKSPWVKIRNPTYTQIDGRHDLFARRGRR